MSKFRDEDQDNENYTIYVLKCKMGKYYIGRTSNLERRFEQHYLRDGFGSAWTKKYNVVKVLEIIKGEKFDEDKTVKKYMANYGIENVRGGSYSRIELKKEEIDLIEKEIKNAYDLCLKCGKSGHFVKNCDENISSSEEEDNYDFKKNWGDRCFLCDKSGHLSKNCKNMSIKCLKCGRIGHIAQDCFAKTTIEGNLIRENFLDSTVELNIKNKDIFEKNSSKLDKKDKISSIICFKCGRIGHFAQDCFANTTIEGNSIKENNFHSSFEIYKNKSDSFQEKTKLEKNEKISSIICFKCGRIGHIAQDCFANSKVQGDSIKESKFHSSFELNRNNYNVFDKTINLEKNEKISTIICFKCGRNGHSALNCFAKTTLEGNSLKENGFDWVVELNKNKNKVFEEKSKLDNNDKTSLFICFKCGRNGHIAKDCFANSTVQGDSINESKIHSSFEPNKNKVIEKIKNSDKNDKTSLIICFKCGRNGHSAMTCYAKTTVEGDSINESKYHSSFEPNKNKVIEKIKNSDKNDKTSSIICFKCGRNGHSAMTCYAKTTVEGDSIKETNYNLSNETNNNKNNVFDKISKSKKNDKTSSIICFKCGRNGHTSQNCFAKTKI